MSFKAVNLGGSKGGDGTVKSVASVQPDVNGNVPLTASDVNAVPVTAGQRLITTAEALALKAIKIKSSRIGALIDKQIAMGKFQVPNSGFSAGTRLTESAQIQFVPKVSFHGLEMIFPNAVIGSPNGNAGELMGLNDIVVRCSIYDGATRRRITFNGQDSVTIRPGQLVKNDILPITFLKDKQYYLFVNVAVGTMGQKWPIGLTIQPTLSEGLVDVDITGGATGTALATSAYYHPIVAMGTPLQVTNYGNIGIVGNSIAEGKSNGGTGVNIDSGFVRRGLDALNLPWVRCAIGGGQMTTFFDATKTNGTMTSIALSSITGCDTVISEFGVNDITTVATLDDMKARYLYFWSGLKASGVQYLVQSTITPRPGITTAQEAVRVGVNDWIRTLPAPLDNYVEVADLAETARNSGIWKTNYSSDNIHPTVTGETALAAAITLAKLGLA